MELNNIIELRQVSFDELNEIVSKGQLESRKLEDNEMSRFNELKDKIEKLDKEIEEKRSVNNVIINNNNLKINENKSMNNKNVLLRAISAYMNGQTPDEEVRSMLAEGTREFVANGLEYRGLQIPMEYRADIVAASNPAISTETWSILEPLQANLALLKAGAQYINLTGNQTLPSYSGTQAAWESENDNAQNGGGTFSSKSMTAKRLTTFIDVSKQFLNQTSPTAEAFLQRSIINAINLKLTQTAFGAHAHSDKMPDGIYTGVAKTSFKVSGSTDWTKIVSLETGVDSNNAITDNMCYIVHPTLKGVLKTTVKASGTAEYIIKDNEMNGYKVITTTCMPTISGETGIVFGNFTDMVVGQFGGLDIVVDQYSQAIAGKVRIVINSYWDIQRLRDESFAIGSLK